MLVFSDTVRTLQTISTLFGIQPIMFCHHEFLLGVDTQTLSVLTLSSCYSLCMLQNKLMPP